MHPIYLILLFGALGSAQNCTPPILDLLFILDSTPSVREDQHILIKKFVSTFVQKLPISIDGSRVGLVQFTPSARPEFYANIYLQKVRLLTAIGDVPYAPCNNVVACYGASYDNASISYVSQLGLSTAVGNRPAVPDAVIFVTTGIYRPLVRQPSVNFSTPTSARYVFTVQIGSSGNITDYTVPFASGISRLGANGYQYLQQLVEPLCEAIVKAVTNSGSFGNNPRDSFIGYPDSFYPPNSGLSDTTNSPNVVVGSASVFNSACAAPLLVLFLVALIFILMLAFVVYHVRKRNKELEAKLKESAGKWAQRDITAKSIQATHGPGSGFTRFSGNGTTGRRTEATQTPPGSLDREDSVEEEDILITSFGADDQIKLIENGKKGGKHNKKKKSSKGTDKESSFITEKESELVEEAETVNNVETTKAEPNVQNEEPVVDESKEDENIQSTSNGQEKEDEKQDSDPPDPKPNRPHYLRKTSLAPETPDHRAPRRTPSIDRELDLSQGKPKKLRSKKERDELRLKAEAVGDSGGESVFIDIGGNSSDEEKEVQPIGDSPEERRVRVFPKGNQPRKDEETMTDPKMPRPEATFIKDGKKGRKEGTKVKPFGFQTLRKQKTSVEQNEKAKKKRTNVITPGRITLSDTEVMEKKKKKENKARVVSPNNSKKRRNELEQIERELDGRSASVAGIERELTQFIRNIPSRHIVGSDVSPTLKSAPFLAGGGEEEGSGVDLQAKSPQLDAVSRITRDHPISVYKMPLGQESSSDNLKSDAEGFDDGTLTPIFFRDLDDENKRHNPYSNQHLPSDHPAFHLPPVDIVFLVDNSGSIGNLNFQRIKDFLAKISDDVYIAPNKSRMAIIQFNIEPTIYFSFDKFFSNPSVKRSIQRIPYSGGGTHLGKALDFAASFLNHAKKGRKKRLQILAVLSDGFTEDNVESAAKNLHETTKAKLAAIGVREGYSLDKLEVLTRDPKGIFHLTDPERFSNWIFKQQYQWQETVESGQRADTASLEMVRRKQEVALGLEHPPQLPRGTVEED